jgi:sugar lactone lactonase YvrE
MTSRPCHPEVLRRIWNSIDEGRRSLASTLRMTALLLSVGVVHVGCKSNEPKVATNPQKAGQLARAKDSDQRSNQVNSDKLELVATVTGPMPTGIAVSKTNRVFTNFPRWGDPVEYTVAEIVNGKIVPFPSKEMNDQQNGDPAKVLIAVQSVVIDDQDRLWCLDTASINFTPPKSNGPKLVCIDLKSNQVTKTINFKPDVALQTTYLNDVRFDLNRGREGMAFITDSSQSGPNGIIVVDLASGDAWRRLNDHPSTKAEPNFAPIVEGEPLMTRIPGKPEAYIKIGSDGIAISQDKKTLFYCPLAGHHLYSVSVDALADRNTSDQDVAATVKDLGDRGYASDGLETGPDGTLYLSDYEHNAIHARDASGQNDRVLVADPRMIWPDTLSATGADGYLYFTANQLNRQKNYHNGKDLRKQPYAIFRFPTQGGGGRSATASAR